MKKLSLLIMIVVLVLVGSVYAFAEEEIIELYVGESISLDTKVISGEVIKDYTGIEWSYDTPNIVSVNSNDVLTGKQVGNVTVIGHLNKGSTILEVRIKVNVKNTVKAVETSTPDQNIRVGESFSTNYTIVPADSLTYPLNQNITYQSSNTKVCTINSNGGVTATGLGEAYIIIKSAESGKSASIKVTVEPTVKRISVEPKDLTIYVGQEYPLTVDYIPLEGKEIFLKESTYKSDDTNVVTVDEKGVLKGKTAGNTVARAISKDNLKESPMLVTVKNGVKDIKIAEKDILLSPSNLSVKLTPIFEAVSGLSEPYEKGVKWSSSNTSVCTISSDGILVGKKSGKVTITAEAVDGGDKAYTFVTVNIPTIPTTSQPDIRNATFNITSNHVNVGEKVRLDVTVEPSDANKSQLKFAVGSSEFGRVFQDGDDFYYQAIKEGAIYVTVSANGVKLDEEIFFAKSMISGFNISESNLEKLHGTNVIYLGQKIELLPSYTMVTGSEPLLNNVKYTSSDSKLAKIVDSKYLEGVDLGFVTITGVSEDSAIEDTVTFNVLSNIKEIITEKSAKIGIGMNYVPTVDFVSIDSPLYNQSEVLKKDIVLKIEKIMASADFIKTELDYTIKRKAELEDLLTASSGDEQYSNELSKCNERLIDYQEVYSRKVGDFCDLTSYGKKLMDRNYNKMDVAVIKNNALVANFVSEIDLKVETKDPKVHTTIKVSVEDNTNSIVIYDINGNIIESSSEQVVSMFTKDELYKSNPSSWATDSIENANSKGLLIKEVIDDYQAQITREEFVALIMNFYDAVLPNASTDVGSNPFGDTNNDTIVRAYNLDIINGKGQGVFAPNDQVTREEMCVIIDKTIKVMSKSLTSKPVSRAFIDKDEISSWALDAVNKMTNQYDILSGVGDNKFSPKGNATKEQAIVLIYKIFNSIN